MVEKALHIDVDGQIKENMDISLVCTVNAHTKKPQWFHNNNEITQSSRVVAVSQGLEHKLIIQFEDDGFYVVAFDRVTSCTTMTVKGEADLSVKLQLSERLYTNWVRSVLGLKYLKLGLEGIAEKEVKCRHTEMLKILPNLNLPCTQCSTDSIYPLHNKKQCYRKQNKNKCLCSDYQQNRRPCPNRGYCSLFYDQIVSDHRFEHPELENTQLDRWSYDPWSVATCYINTKGYKEKGSSKEIDCAGLLSLFINNKRYLTDVNYGVFDMARTTRNEILHNANYELSDDQLHEYFDNFKDVLEVKNNANKMVFAKDESVKEALKNIDKLKQHQINIVTLEEIQNLKDHAMKEAADMFKEAQKQRDQEVQHLNEKLKKAEEELQVIRQLRSAFERDSRLEEKEELLVLVLRLGIRVVTPVGESASEIIQRVLWFIQYAAKNNRILREDSIPPIFHTFKKTYKSVQQILGKIFVSQDTPVEVMQDQSDVSFKINCISSKDLETRLTIYHGVDFQEAIADLQKSLETEDERKRKYDVDTCCSSQNLKNITKQLFDHGVMNGSCTDFRCERHDGTQCSWYCGEHEKFFCKSCKETNHRSCFGLNKLGEGEGQGKLELKLKSFITPRPGFQISCICTLPNDDVLIGSRYSADLMKLGSSYDLISRCVLPSTPSSVCYIGNGRAAAVCGNKLVFLDVTSNNVLYETLLPIFEMKSIACHGDMIYICDRESLYTCNTNGTNLRNVYSVKEKTSILKTKKQIINLGSHFESIAVSDNGETIYIIDQSKLHIIHSNGDLLSNKEIVQGPVGICCLGNDLIVCCNRPRVLKQLDFKGDDVKMHKLNDIFSIVSLPSLCYDRKRSNLIVGCEEGDILVFDIKYTL
ncbi:uncharacterized protein LOC128553188 [Mercenaria mercenaria]|uniref:uncharacterized protein LOC128553188 n=1 Tax=Mercenaria mercenaria TaxID=6596 RepID=UPI00234F023B|nr:uncharacterized protein LOC128553188 [Mercenaria mercenaria]